MKPWLAYITVASALSHGTRALSHGTGALSHGTGAGANANDGARQGGSASHLEQVASWLPDMPSMNAIGERIADVPGRMWRVLSSPKALRMSTCVQDTLMHPMAIIGLLLYFGQYYLSYWTYSIVIPESQRSRKQSGVSGKESPAVPTQGPGGSRVTAAVKAGAEKATEMAGATAAEIKKDVASLQWRKSHFTEQLEDCIFLVSIDCFIYAMIDHCKSSWASSGLVMFLTVDSILALVRTRHVGWVTRNDPRLAHVEVSPRHPPAIAHWMTVGVGSEPGRVIKQRDSKYYIKAENCFQDIENPDPSPMILRMVGMFVLMFWLTRYLIYGQDVFDWNMTYDHNWNPLPEQHMKHKNHAFWLFLSSIVIQMLASNMVGRNFFHNLTWWNMLCVEDISIGSDGDRRPASSIMGRIKAGFLFAFVGRYVFTNMIMFMTPLLLTQEISGFDFAKDVFALTYIATMGDLDDCKEIEVSANDPADKV